MNVNLRHCSLPPRPWSPRCAKQAAAPSSISVRSAGTSRLPELVLYQTAKAAIAGLTRSLARDLGRDNIRVNTIVPGNVKTPRQEKWYTPEGEAEIVAAQCLDGPYRALRRGRAGAVSRLRRRAHVHRRMASSSMRVGADGWHRTSSRAPAGDRRGTGRRPGVDRWRLVVCRYQRADRVPARTRTMRELARWTCTEHVGWVLPSAKGGD